MNNVTVNLSNEMEKLINNISKKNNISRENVINKAFALLKIYQDQKSKGNFLGSIIETEKDQYKIINIIR